MRLLGEVYPAAPALAALIELAVLLFTFAMTWLVRILVLALFGWLIDALASIPGIGGYLAYPFVKIEQALAYALGTAEHAIDAAIGASWHLLARYMDWMWREIRGHAVLLLELASGLYPLVVAYHALKALLHHNTAASGVAAARVKTLERDYRGIEAKVKTLERDYSHGIGHDVLPRLKTLEREAARIENEIAIPARDRYKTAGSAIDHLYEWAKGKASLLGVGTFSLAVATAIGADVFNGLRCTNFGNLMRKFGCGLGTLIDGLLGIMVSIIGLELVCDYLPFIEAAFGAIEGPMVKLLNEVPLGRCEIPPKSWATLAVKRGPLPPPQTLGRLAA